MSWCVYAHVNKKNGAVYVGITSQEPEARFRRGRGYKNNLHFARAIEKYGWDAFDHIVMAKGQSESDAKDIERRVIAALKEDGCTLYNLTDGGDGMVGSKLSAESVRKISAALRGKPKSPEHKRKLSEVRIGRFTGADNPNYGHHLSEDAKRRIGDARRGNKNINYGRAGQETTASKAVTQYSIDGELIAEFPSLSEASRVTGIGISGISKCCLGQFKQSHGYMWKFSTSKSSKDMNSSSQ